MDRFQKAQQELTDLRTDLKISLSHSLLSAQGGIMSHIPKPCYTSPPE